MSKGEKNSQTLPELLTLKEACEVLKCHPNTLRQWDAKGILTAMRIGKKKMLRYDAKEIISFIQRNNEK